jgi:hypothetical protein
MSHISLETAVFRKFLSLKTALLPVILKEENMSKVFSVIFFTAAIFVGQQIVFSCKNYSNVAKASPGDPNENWYLKKNGNPTTVRVFKGNTSSDTASQYGADISVSIYPKEGSRPHTLINIMEYESHEQFSGKGKFRAIYTGTFDGSRVRGTYYDNDGASGSFLLTR